MTDRVDSSNRRLSRALAWTGLVIGVIAIALQAPLTIAEQMDNGQSLFEAIAFFLSFFTIWTNIGLVLVYGAVLALIGGPFGQLAKPALFSGLLLAIALVAAVYHLLLAGLRDLRGLWALADLLLHTLAPMIMAAWWLGQPRHGHLAIIDPLRWTLFPIAYLVFALAQSFVTGWVPYPFLDYHVDGWGSVITMCVVIGLAFVLAGYLLYALDNRLARQNPN